MKKDEIFFGTEGLTSTSANYIANMAKEYYMQKNKILEEMQFYSTTVSIIGATQYHVIECGISNELFSQIPTMIADISKAKSLIAWLREALAARDRLKSEILNMSETDYCKLKGIDAPIMPTKGSILTEDEYWGSMSIKARNAYYELETKCATLGKFIHPNGHYAEERDAAVKKSNTPHKVTGTGRDTNIFTYELTIPLTDIEQQFFDLQKKYREYQANLNSLKFECQNAIEKSEAKVNAEYTAASREYSSKRSALLAEMREWQQAEIVNISKLKIIIPDSLQDIYNKISSLGKKN